MLPSFLNPRRLQRPAGERAAKSPAETPQRRLPLLLAWHYRSFLLFISVGVTLLIVGRNLLPTGADPTSPVPPVLDVRPLDPDVSVDTVDYTAWTNLSPRRVEIDVSGTIGPHSKSSLVELYVSGMKISHPSQRSVTAAANGGDFVLNLKDAPGSTTGSAQVSFYAGDRAFGYSASGVQAVVALPGIEYGDEHSIGSGPVLTASYWIASANGYDWSAFPPTEESPGPGGSDYLLWTEKPTDRSVPGRIAFGVDHNQQSVDDRNTFVAGALIGLGGAAVVAALQELLHTPFIRRRKRAESASRLGAHEAVTQKAGSDWPEPDGLFGASPQGQQD
jgi:hypothetical protein